MEVLIVLGVILLAIMSNSYILKASAVIGLLFAVYVFQNKFIYGPSNRLSNLADQKITLIEI